VILFGFFWVGVVITFMGLTVEWMKNCAQGNNLPILVYSFLF